MERLRLIRGEALLGVVTHAPEEWIDGGAPWDVGWLESAPDFDGVRHLFEREQQLFDKAVQFEMETGAKGPSSEPARLLEQAATLQRIIMAPGVRLIYLSSGRQIEVDELHIEGAKVFWR
jgi:hypothetical protein